MSGPERICDQCGLPHPDTNPYCFCRADLPTPDPRTAALVEALRAIADMPDYRLPKPQDIARAALAAWEA